MITVNQVLNGLFENISLMRIVAIPPPLSLVFSTLNISLRILKTVMFVCENFNLEDPIDANNERHSTRGKLA